MKSGVGLRNRSRPLSLPLSHTFLCRGRFRTLAVSPESPAGQSFILLREPECFHQITRASTWPLTMPANPSLCFFLPTVCYEPQRSIKMQIFHLQWPSDCSEPRNNHPNLKGPELHTSGSHISYLLMCLDVHLSLLKFFLPILFHLSTFKHENRNCTIYVHSTSLTFVNPQNSTEKSISAKTSSYAKVCPYLELEIGVV